MIAFSCAGCRKSFSVKDEFAGRNTKCPKCGTSIVVPAAAKPVAAVPVATAPSPSAGGLEAHLMSFIREASVPAVEALVAVVKKDHACAEKFARAVLQKPAASESDLALAIGIAGFIHKRDGRYLEAQQCLEKALAGTGSWVSALEFVFADLLGDAYGLGIQMMLTQGEMEEARSLCPKLAYLISRFKDRPADEFHRVRHEGWILLARGSIAGHDRQVDQAIQYLGQLLKSPYNEYFSAEETLKFVIGQACRNIGRIYHLAYGRSDEAIPYLEASLRYFAPDDEEFTNGQVVLEKVRRKAGLIREISFGWDKLAWGSSLGAFQRRFRRATQDETWWLTGEAPGEFAGFRLSEIKFAFNVDGELFMIVLFADEPSTVMEELPGTLGAPDEAGRAGWTYGKVKVSVKGGGNIVALTNTAFDTDPEDGPDRRATPPPVPVEEMIPGNDDELIEFECEECGELMEIKTRMAGRKVRCIECDQVVRVPS